MTAVGTAWFSNNSLACLVYLVNWAQSPVDEVDQAGLGSNNFVSADGRSSVNVATLMAVW